MSTPKLLSSSQFFVPPFSALFFSVGYFSTCFAQETSSDGQVVEEVVVTGIRSSLENAMDLKRDSQGVVDAISAEDIGKFPDANLAESLQRITGVSIDRQNNEGNQITVRGLGPSFNMVTLNGRQMPVASSPEQESIASATQSRAFNFAEIASESVSAVEVFKTGRADLTTGGMGATVNIKTARPLDTGDKIVANVKAVHDSSVESGDEITPELGGLFSKTFLDGILGVLVNASYSDRQFSELSTHTDGWLRDDRFDEFEQETSLYSAWCNGDGSQCGDAPYVYRPVSNISEVKNFKRQRTNAQLVFQAEPLEGLVATLDYTLSRFNREEDRFGTGLFGVVGGNTITNTRLAENFTVQSANRLNLAADALVYDNEVRIENDSVGFNLNWQLNDEITLEFDTHISEAESQPDGELNDNLAILQGTLGINFGLNYSGSGVDIDIDDSGANRGVEQFGAGEPRPNVDQFQDPDGLSPLGTVIRNISIENDVKQYQLKAEWSSEPVSISAGFSYVDYQVKTNAISTGFEFQGLGNCEGCSDLIRLIRIDAPSGFSVANEFDVNRIVEETFPNQPADILARNPPTFFGITEESTAVFLTATYDFEIAGLTSQISGGLRYESTDVTGNGFQTFPVELQITSNTEGQENFSTDTPPVFTQVESGYDFLLPSVDFMIQPTEDMVARLSYSRTIARPDLNALRPILSISDYRPGNSAASEGNPNLRPYRSDNFDFSFEWYYSDGSYASIAYFYKDVDDYIATETFEGTVPSADGSPVRDPQGRYVPTTSPGEQPIVVTSQADDPDAIFQISRSFNGEAQSLDGIEFAVQHLLGESGFGVQANYTIVDSDAEYDSNNFGQQTVLIGLSDSANLVGFYENDLLSARLALNWRDDFLLATGQLRATDEPTFVDDYMQLDFSSSYNINDSLTAVFEILNLTGEDQQQRGRFSNQFLFENDQKPRFALGLRGNF